MGIQNLFIFFLLSIVHAQNPCPTSYCDRNALAIKFPFWLQNQKPQPCTPPAFNLTCNSQKKAILYIPHSGEFYVDCIYYYIKRVVLYDPQNCLPRKLRSFNLSSSPLTAFSYQDYTFFSCPKGSVSPSSVLSCLSNANTDVVATKYTEDLMGRYNYCNKTFTLPVPVSSSYDNGLFPVSIDLTWDVPAVSAPNKQHASRTIALIFVIPALSIPLLIGGVSRYICMTRHENSQTADPIRTFGGVGLSDRSAAVGGLDKSTIETYRKITVGASRHVEGPSGVTCTICLADYVPEETIKFMPKCQHCFHAECIDKWLSMNSKCPICRT